MESASTVAGCAASRGQAGNAKVKTAPISRACWTVWDGKRATIQFQTPNPLAPMSRRKCIPSKAIFPVAR